LKIQE